MLHHRSNTSDLHSICHLLLPFNCHHSTDVNTSAADEIIDTARSSDILSSNDASGDVSQHRREGGSVVVAAAADGSGGGGVAGMIGLLFNATIGRVGHYLRTRLFSNRR